MNQDQRPACLSKIQFPPIMHTKSSYFFIRRRVLLVKSYVPGLLLSQAGQRLPSCVLCMGSRTVSASSYLGVEIIVRRNVVVFFVNNSSLMEGWGKTIGSIWPYGSIAWPWVALHQSLTEWRVIATRPSLNTQQWSQILSHHVYGCLMRCNSNAKLPHFGFHGKFGREKEKLNAKVTKARVMLIFFVLCFLQLTPFITTFEWYTTLYAILEVPRFPLQQVISPCEQRSVKLLKSKTLSMYVWVCVHWKIHGYSIFQDLLQIKSKVFSRNSMVLPEWSEIKLFFLPFSCFAFGLAFLKQTTCKFPPGI